MIPGKQFEQKRRRRGIQILEQSQQQINRNGKRHTTNSRKNNYENETNENSLFSSIVLLAKNGQATVLPASLMNLGVVKQIFRT